MSNLKKDNWVISPDELEDKYGKRHLSYSSLKKALKDINKWEMHMRGQDRYESQALSFGSLYDGLLFERELTMKKYKVRPTDDDVIAKVKELRPEAKNIKATKEYKELLQQQEGGTLEEGQEWVNTDDWHMANDMINRLRDCGIVDKYFDGDYQVEFNERVCGIPVKGFFDNLSPDKVVDSKSTVGLGKFKWQVNDLAYDIQAYLYTQVAGIDTFYWVAQEKTKPYLPAVIKATKETLFSGEMKVQQAISIIRNHLNNMDRDPNYLGSSHYLEYEI